MDIPLEARIFWPSTVGTIPAGWTRDTDFDEVFLQGSASAGDPGGAATHDHTATAHLHGGNSHTHSLTVGGAAAGNDSPSGSANTVAQHAHTHAAATSASATETYQNTAVDIDVAAAPPPYFKVIVIKPDSQGTKVPVDGVALTDDTTAPGDFEITDGTGGTPQLGRRFLLGANAAGDGGGTGGIATHTHNSPAHTHAAAGHVHADSDFAASSATLGCNSGFSAVGVSTVHHRAKDIDIASAGMTSDQAVLNAASTLPAFKYLLGIQNKGASAHTPLGIIVPFVGTSIPHNWLECDGSHGTPDLSAVQIQVTDDGDDVGDMGGSNTHAHVNVPHSHTSSGVHTHTYTFQTVNTRSLFTVGVGIQRFSTSVHTHSSNAMSGVNGSIIDNNMAMSSEDVRAPYRTVIWIKHMGPPAVAFGPVA